MMNKDEFIKMLTASKRAPILFIGSGFTRHYFNSPDWKGILEKFAPYHINKYYSELGADYLPAIASAIAADVNQRFWLLPDDDPFKIQYQNKAVNKSSILKIKMAEYFRELSELSFPKKYRKEISILSSLNIDGIITTNWDNTLERIFPSFTTFIGQKELIFTPTYNMAEIYKIHGCMTRPESMVLTQEDYSDFNDRNPYLAAKLTVLFIEHPVVFIGYSITDNNIQEILKSIVNCLDQENIMKLQNNLIFVEWIPNKDSRFIIEKYDISLGNKILLPVTRIKTHEYLPVYECLSYYERNIPTSLLREYKKQFYNIVVSEKPEKQLYVLPGSQIDLKPEIQVVYGFGAINKYHSAIGYSGLSAVDIMRDVVEGNTKLDPEKILLNTIKSLKRSSPMAYLPVYKYLFELGIQGNDSYKKNHLKIKIELKRERDFQSYPINNKDRMLSISSVIDEYEKKNTIWKAIAIIPYLNISSENDLASLRSFILKYFDDFLIKSNNYSTYMRKLICFYDWKKYGW